MFTQQSDAFLKAVFYVNKFDINRSCLNLNFVLKNFVILSWTYSFPCLVLTLTTCVSVKIL